MIDFLDRTSIQSQALADFVAEWTPSEKDVELPSEDEIWQVHCDGSYTATGAGAATILRSPSGIKTAYVVRLEFPSTNNVAEYEAVMLGLRKLKALGVKRVVLMSDSQVISEHIEKTAEAKDERLRKYLHTIRRMETHFEGFTVKKIFRRITKKLMHWRGQHLRESLCQPKYSLKS